MQFIQSVDAVTNAKAETLLPERLYWSDTPMPAGLMTLLSETSLGELLLPGPDQDCSMNITEQKMCINALKIDDLVEPMSAKEATLQDITPPMALTLFWTIW